MDAYVTGKGIGAIVAVGIFSLILSVITHGFDFDAVRFVKFFIIIMILFLIVVYMRGKRWL